MNEKKEGFSIQCSKYHVNKCFKTLQFIVFQLEDPKTLKKGSTSRTTNSIDSLVVMHLKTNKLSLRLRPLVHRVISLMVSKLVKALLQLIKALENRVYAKSTSIS